MSENTNEIDVDADLTGIDTSFPRLVAGKYDFILGKVEKKTSGDGDKEYLEVHHTTTHTIQSTGGESLPAGHVAVNRISLTPTAKNSVDSIRKRVASLVQAAKVKTMNDLIKGEASGRTIKVNVKINKETPEFDESNSFNYIVARD